MKKISALLFLLVMGFGANSFMGAMEQQVPRQEPSAQEQADEADILPEIAVLHFLLNVLQGVDGPVRLVLVKNCEKPSLPLPRAKDQLRCYICERVYDDLERIAVLPCGDTLCCRCADRAISCRECCPVCDMHVDGYRTQPYFFKIKKFRNDKMDLPLLQKGCTVCAVCLEEFSDCQDIALLPCGHAFCIGCADHALTMKEQCPSCRAAASGYRQRKFFK